MFRTQILKLTDKEYAEFLKSDFAFSLTETQMEEVMEERAELKKYEAKVAELVAMSDEEYSDFLRTYNAMSMCGYSLREVEVKRLKLNKSIYIIYTAEEQERIDASEY